MSNQLVKFLKKENYLRVLSFVDANLTENSLEILANIIHESYKLREFSCSWNVGVRPRAYLKMVQNLGQSKFLTSIDLSYNTIVDFEEV